MEQPESALVHHRYLKPGFLPVCTGFLLIIIITIAALIFSMDLSAGSRMQKPVDTHEADLPVVNLKQTRSLAHIVGQLANATFRQHNF